MNSCQSNFVSFKIIYYFCIHPVNVAIARSFACEKEIFSVLRQHGAVIGFRRVDVVPHVHQICPGAVFLFKRNIQIPIPQIVWSTAGTDNHIAFVRCYKNIPFAVFGVYLTAEMNRLDKSAFILSGIVDVPTPESVSPHSLKKHSSAV